MSDYKEYAVLPEYIFGECIEDKFGHKMPRVQEGKLNWYHPNPPPMIGTMVTAGRCGAGKVTGYFSEDAYLGLLVEIDKPSDWFLKQRKKRIYSGRGRDVLGNWTVNCFGPEFNIID